MYTMYIPFDFLILNCFLTFFIMCFLNYLKKLKKFYWVLIVVEHFFFFKIFKMYSQ